MSDPGNALVAETLTADATLAQRAEAAYEGRRRMFDRCHELLNGKRCFVPLEKRLHYMLALGAAEQQMYLNLVNLQHRPQRGMSITTTADGGVQVDLFEEYDNWSDERIRAEAVRLAEQAGLALADPAVIDGETP